MSAANSSRVAPIVPLAERQGLTYKHLNGVLRAVPTWSKATESDTPKPVAPVVVSAANAVAIPNDRIARLHETEIRFVVTIDGEFRGAPRSIAAAQGQVDWLIGAGFVTLSQVRITPVEVSAAL